jgi:hypothetical protein
VLLIRIGATAHAMPRRARLNDVLEDVGTRTLHYIYDIGVIGRVVCNYAYAACNYISLNNLHSGLLLSG